MDERSYNCEACGMTSRLSAVNCQENLTACPWCGEPFTPHGQEGPNEAEEHESPHDA